MEEDILPETERWERDIEGHWVPVGLNPVKLFARYESGGHFAPHTDGSTIESFNHRSLWSVIIYLNDCDGGETRMLREEALTQLALDADGRYRGSPAFAVTSVAPRAGRVLVFHQSLAHEGCPPAEAHLKYIIRSDVMFDRTPAICDSARDREAFEVYNEAKEAEGAGQLEEAVAGFKRFIRMSPVMADIYGM